MQILMSNESHLGIDSIFEYISHDSIKYASKTSLFINLIKEIILKFQLISLKRFQFYKIRKHKD